MATHDARGLDILVGDTLVLVKEDRDKAYMAEIGLKEGDVITVSYVDDDGTFLSNESMDSHGNLYWLFGEMFAHIDDTFEEDVFTGEEVVFY